MRGSRWTATPPAPVGRRGHTTSHPTRDQLRDTRPATRHATSHTTRDQPHDTGPATRHATSVVSRVRVSGPRCVCHAVFGFRVHVACHAASRVAGPRPVPCRVVASVSRARSARVPFARQAGVPSRRCRVPRHRRADCSQPPPAPPRTGAAPALLELRVLTSRCRPAPVPGSAPLSRPVRCQGRVPRCTLRAVAAHGRRTRRRSWAATRRIRATRHVSPDTDPEPGHTARHATRARGTTRDADLQRSPAAPPSALQTQQRPSAPTKRRARALRADLGQR